MVTGWPVGWAELVRESLVYFLITLIGYFAVSGIVYGWLFTGKSGQRSGHGQLTLAARWRSVRHDVALSVASCGIFALCAAIMTQLYLSGHTRLYADPQAYGWGYLVFSLVLVLFLQDTYFYFTHRLAHHPWCFRWLHKGHHYSHQPTPWTGFAFDPAEALLQAIYLMLAVWLIPMHAMVLCAVVLVMSLGALVHHFSLRLFQSSQIGDWMGQWIVGPCHHWYHHRKFTAHYGLYFTFWDKVMGTHCDGYEVWLTEALTDRSALSVEAVSGPVESISAEAAATESAELVGAK